jgi:hypothetical protein
VEDEIWIVCKEITEVKDLLVWKKIVEVKDPFACRS